MVRKILEFDRGFCEDSFNIRGPSYSKRRNKVYASIDLPRNDRRFFFLLPRDFYVSGDFLMS